ncbi:MAG: hypothetical protein K2Q20_14155, partial [Phycisphaerales bacterium]|nr:hypothetical protein [Phycisphaerales bacterium]
EGPGREALRSQMLDLLSVSRRRAEAIELACARRERDPAPTSALADPVNLRQMKSPRRSAGGGS